jgi:hypothetical protein
MERRYRVAGLRRVMVVLAVVVGTAAGPTSVAAAEEGAVDASVEVQNPAACIVLGGTVIDFGVQRFSTASHVEGASGTPTIVTNCSGGDADLVVRTTRATNEAGTVEWSPVSNGETCNGGPNTFAHGVLYVTTGVMLSETNQSLIPNSGHTSHLSDGEQIGFGHAMNMPCTGSDGNGETMSWVVTFTAILP